MPRVKVAYWWNALNGGHEFGYECDSLSPEWRFWLGWAVAQNAGRPDILSECLYPFIPSWVDTTTIGDICDSRATEVGRKMANVIGKKYAALVLARIKKENPTARKTLSAKWLKSERRRICAPTRASSKAQKLRGLSPKYIVVDEMSPRFRQSKAAAARARSKNGRLKAHKPRSRRKA